MRRFEMPPHVDDDDDEEEEEEEEENGVEVGRVDVDGSQPIETKLSGLQLHSSSSAINDENIQVSPSCYARPSMLRDRQVCRNRFMGAGD